MAPGPETKPHRRWPRVVLAVGAVLILVAIGLVLWLPGFVKRRVIAEAAAHGVVLTIDNAAIGIGRARFFGVTAKLAAVPQITGHASQVEIGLDWLTPSTIDAKDASIDLDGSAAEVITSFDRWSPSLAASPSPIQRITLAGARIQWKHLAGERPVLDATGVSCEAKQAAGGWGVKLTTESLGVTIGSQKLGPWSLDATASATKADVHLALAPGKSPAGVALAWAAAQGSTLDVNVPKGTSADVGIPAAVLGMVGDESSTFALELHHTQKGAAGQGAIAIAADRVYLGHSPAPTSLQLDATYQGAPAKLVLQTGSLRAGPFTGALKGSVALPGIGGVPGPLGMVADLHYTSGLMSCSDAAKAATVQNLGGDVGKGVNALAHMLGMDKVVQGSVQLEATIAFDTRALPKATVQFRTKGDCALTYLPSP